MKTFEVVAFNSSGKKKVSTIRARSLSEAKRKIHQGGLYLVSIKIQNSLISHGQSSFSFFEELGNLFNRA